MLNVAIGIIAGVLVLGIAIMIPFIIIGNIRLAKQRELIAEKRGELAAINRQIESLKSDGMRG